MYNFIANLLSWLYGIWPSYGGAIVLLTMLIMLVMAPITVRQTRSMMAMQRLQPEVKRLRSKYGDDRERLNQEMMALYQANNVNPLGGCLPILIQLPVFLVLFQVVRGLTRRVTDAGLALGATSFGSDRVVVDFDERTFNPDYLSESSQLAQDLREATEMNSFGLDLSESASSALADSVVTGVPYLLLVIGVGVTTWLQQKQIQGRQKTSEMNPQQQMIMKVLPFMLPIFSFGFPAALVVYWFVSNLFRVGQQMFITKRVYGTEDDEIEIVRPEPTDTKSTATKTARRGSGTDKAGSGSSTHGRRSPVSTPPPKKRKKPPAAKKQAAAPSKKEAAAPTKKQAAAKRTPPQSRERQERPTSKRVTPKKSTRPEPVSRRRDKKKR